MYGTCVEIVYAYNVLASKRTSGLASNPIQLSEIEAYLRIYGQPSIPVDVFIDLIGIADLKYLELTNGNESPGKR